MKTSKKHDRPILMTGSMVRATLKDEKMQSRRIVIPQQSTPRVPPLDMEPWIIDGERQEDDDGLPCWLGVHPDYPTGDKWFSCPYGGPGWRLWVRESLYERGAQWHYKADDAPVLVDAAQRAACVAWAHHKQTQHCPSIHMPRWASRIMLELVNVRVERLCNISAPDALAEGCGTEPCARCDESGESEGGICEDCAGEGRYSEIQVFRRLWDQINSKRYAWSDNPWVWVLEFKRLAQGGTHGSL